MKYFQMNTICLLTRTLHPIWLDFLNRFSKYRIIIVVDDNSENYAEKYADYIKTNTNIQIIQLPNELCREQGYTNCNSCVGFNEIISWDKALYYFNHIDTIHHGGDIWFIEDDVFFMNEDTLINIDKQYLQSDLLTSFHETNHSGEMYSWNHWVNVVGRIELPWSHSMVCACRMSRRLLGAVDEYVKKRGQLYFIESMFNTLAQHNNMKIDNPIELSSVHWNTNWDKTDIDNTKVYHPFKNIEDHSVIRTSNSNHPV